MKITPLRQSDEGDIREWAGDYLSTYLAHHARISGRPMAPAELVEHIEENELVSALWHDVIHADYGDTEFVAVIRQHHEPLGLILAEERIEPFLRLAIGSIRWIYIAPEQRGKGYSALLIRAAHDWMQKRGVAGRETTLAANNEAALGLFDKLGYAALEVRLAAPPPAAPG